MQDRKRSAANLQHPSPRSPVHGASFSLPANCHFHCAGMALDSTLIRAASQERFLNHCRPPIHDLASLTPSPIELTNLST
ncbi:uncharacterized protein LY79DRAFT_183286 [Colletotrichum navitas]|uniref:Uncharacterized protein n=1 Tax=Colletotrichum navitas TaxID=681940 RepID=A0AAD8V5D1_9PEZI|nr:uncharacterized protein LY79DRAFT_183286 [Colletotrichum navitas]KAK1593283.1 hypothetical protein LY79DRAFT_183286 [Colletotrichum navitas]